MTTIVLLSRQRATLAAQWGLKREQLDQLDDRVIIDLWRFSGKDRTTLVDILFSRPPVPPMPMLRLCDEMPVLATGPNLTTFGGPRAPRGGDRGQLPGGRRRN